MIINERVGGFLKSIRTFNKGGVETTPRHIKQGVNNLIVNSGLDIFITTAFGTATSRCDVGNGTTAPTINDTSIESLVGTAQSFSAGVSQMTTDPDTGQIYNSTIKTYTFAIGSVVGNLSEAAVRSGSDLVSRVLIRDTSGNPTTITVTTDDQLIIEWEFRRYFDPVETTGSFTLTDNGMDSTINYTIYPTEPILHSANNIGVKLNTRLVSNLSVTGSDYTDYSFSGSTFGSTSISTYTDGNYYRDFTVSASSQQGSSDCNGMSTQFTVGLGEYVIGFDQTIPKTSDDTLAITCRYTISRYVAP